MFDFKDIFFWGGVVNSPLSIRFLLFFDIIKKLTMPILADIVSLS